MNYNKHNMFSHTHSLTLLGLLSVLTTSTVIAAPGDLDSTFNPTGTVSGVVTTPIGNSDDFGRALVLQPDGKMIVAGFSYTGEYSDVAVTRYNSDGSLDTTFNGTGKVTTSVGEFNDFGRCVALQPDGQIVVAGYKHASGNPNESTAASNNDFIVIRYHSNGSLDTGFGQSGYVTTAIGPGHDNADACALQPDGKIIVVGYSNTQSDTNIDSPGRNEIAVVRYNSDGSLDTTFNSSGPKPGTVTTAVGVGSDDYGFAVALQPDGQIVVSGRSSSDGIALVRYHGDGSLDTTFNSTGSKPGTLVMPLSDNTSGNYALAVAVQPDGKIVIAGFFFYADDIAVARYNSDGSLDTTFNRAGPQPGIVITPIGMGNAYSFDLVLQPDGKIVVVGKAHSGEDYAITVVRYLSEGSLDTTFGIDGEVTTSISDSVTFLDGDSGYAAALQPDGKLVVAGDTFNGNDYDFAVVRYLMAAAPAAASALQAQAVSPTQVDLSWTDNSSDESGFKIFRNGVELTPSPRVSADMTRLSDSGLTCGTAYTYDVITTNTSGGEAAAATVTVTTLPCAYTLTTPVVGTGTVTGAGSYAAGQLVTLSATAAAGFTFSGWNPAPCAASFTMPANDLTCTATFAAAPVVTPPATGTGTTPTTGTDVTPPASTGMTSSTSTTTESNCPPKTTLEGPCDANFQTVGTIEIAIEGYLTNARIQGTVTNHGWMSNLTIESDATVTGGTITGRVENRGTLIEFEFRGSRISGGTLAGRIVNRKENGVFQDVHLAPAAQITGGRLSGVITSDCTEPATLTHVRILKGSHLSCVTLGEGVVREDNVTVTGLEEVPELPVLGETEARDANGKTITVKSELRGGVTVMNGKDYQKQATLKVALDAVDIVGHIDIDPQHVGQDADLFIYAIYQETPTSEEIYLMRDGDGAIFLWNQQVTDLLPFRAAVKLASKEKITLYQGVLLGQGQLELFFGYRLQDGTVVHNGEPLIVTVE